MRGFQRASSAHRMGERLKYRVAESIPFFCALCVPLRPFPSPSIPTTSRAMWRSKALWYARQRDMRWPSITRAPSKQRWSFSPGIHLLVRRAATPNRNSRIRDYTSWKSHSTGTSSTTALPARNWSRFAWCPVRATCRNARSIRRGGMIQIVMRGARCPGSRAAAPAPGSPAPHHEDQLPREKTALPSPQLGYEDKNHLFLIHSA